MQWLAEICVRRPVFASVLMLTIMVIGIAGYQRLGLDEFPNVDLPIVLITSVLPGAAPEEMETEVSDKIESAVNTIGGIDELRSISGEGVSQVVVTFVLEREIDAAVQDVRDKVNTMLPQLPKGMDPPVIGKVDLGATPIMLLALRSPSYSIRSLTEVADKTVQRQLESINGVGQVKLIGGRKRQINVWLDALGMRSHRVTPGDVQRAIMSQNLTTPGGSLDLGPETMTLRVSGKVESSQAIGRLILSETNGHLIRVQDIAKVEDGAQEEESWAQLDDEQTVVLSILKQSGSNTVAVVDAVKERLQVVRSNLPEGIALDVIQDNSKAIRTGIGSVKEHLILGAIFAALVVLLFLGDGWSTLIAAVSIPISIVGTFGLMWVKGFTLNFITLLALALAVGIVIDDAIVVLENITRFIHEKGIKPFVAAVEATKEIGLAVLATTLSLMAVFLPVAFMGGIPGRFLASFGWTMAFSIAVSLVVSFTLTPALSARWIVAKKGHHEQPNMLHRFVDAFYKPIEVIYLRMLAYVLDRRWLLFPAVIGVFVSSVFLLKALPKGFLPEDDQAQFEVSYRTPEGTSMTATRLQAERLAQDIRLLPGVERVLLTVADDGQKTANLAKISVFLVDPEYRDLDQFALMDRVRKELLPLQPKDCRLTVGELQPINAGSSNANVSYALAGPDLAQLSQYATRITEGLRAYPGAVDVDNTLVVGKPTLRIAIKRDKAADMGVAVSDIASTLQLFVGGVKVSSFAEGGEEFDIRLRAAKSFRADPEQLRLISVPSRKLGTVPLDQVITWHEEAGPAAINRLGRQRQVTINANPAPGYGDSDVVDKLQELYAQEGMPAIYSFGPVGRSKNTDRVAYDFLFAFLLSFIFMYLILAAQFESWLHPFTILFSLPLTVPFALLSLFLFRESFNLFSGLGLLVLFGVVKKNSILQIDHTNQLREQGMARREAIMQANKDRLRPILMTTLAFVAGMIPLMLGHGIGSGQNRAIAGVVLGGQTFSLLLTLLATPVMYDLLDDAALFIGRLLGWRRSNADLHVDNNSHKNNGTQGHQHPAAITS